jgi:deoxyribodipyrimidine photo-lyase
MPSAIHWFRRDLRITDNTALHSAAKTFSNVIPCYVLSNWKGTHGWTGPKRQQFLCESLRSLSANLDALGSRLIIRAGDAVEELITLARQTNAEAIYFNRDPDPFGKAVEARLLSRCQEMGIQCLGIKDAVLHEASEALTGSGQPYRVFTPYSKNWLALPKARPLGKITSLGSASNAVSLPLPTLEHWALTLPADAQIPPAGERAARDRMKAFIETGILDRYGVDRNLPAGQTTSCLSQDLRFGLISIRELYARCQERAAQHPASAGTILTYTKELAWREFYMAILHHYPEVLDREFNPDLRNIEWPGTEEHLQAWATARTGFPIVDAGMRQLHAKRSLVTSNRAPPWSISRPRALGDDFPRRGSEAQAHHRVASGHGEVLPALGAADVRHAIRRNGSQAAPGLHIGEILLQRLGSTPETPA